MRQGILLFLPVWCSEAKFFSCLILDSLSWQSIEVHARFCIRPSFPVWFLTVYPDRRSRSRVGSVSDLAFLYDSWQCILTDGPGPGLVLYQIWLSCMIPDSLSWQMAQVQGWFCSRHGFSVWFLTVYPDSRSRSRVGSVSDMGFRSDSWQFILTDGPGLGLVLYQTWLFCLIPDSLSWQRVQVQGWFCSRHGFPVWFLTGYPDRGSRFRVGSVSDMGFLSDSWHFILTEGPGPAFFCIRPGLTRYVAPLSRVSWWGGGAP